MDDVLSVAVFPLPADRWVAVAATEGAFSTEVDRLEAVEHEMRSVVAQVLRVETPRSLWWTGTASRGRLRSTSGRFKPSTHELWLR
jgi:glucose-6-phosphate dehydrogenase assembly protein OpcA